jgi:hypothetical protein
MRTYEEITFDSLFFIITKKIYGVLVCHRVSRKSIGHYMDDCDSRNLFQQDMMDFASKMSYS